MARIVRNAQCFHRVPIFSPSPINKGQLIILHMRIFNMRTAMISGLSTCAMIRRDVRDRAFPARNYSRTAVGFQVKIARVRSVRLVCHAVIIGIFVGNVASARAMLIVNSVRVVRQGNTAYSIGRRLSVNVTRCQNYHAQVIQLVDVVLMCPFMPRAMGKTWNVVRLCALRVETVIPIGILVPSIRSRVVRFLRHVPIVKRVRHRVGSPISFLRRVVNTRLRFPAIVVCQSHVSVKGQAGANEKQSFRVQRGRVLHVAIVSVNRRAVAVIGRYRVSAWIVKEDALPLRVYRLR